MLKLFIDESADERLFAVAGVLSTAEQWEIFSDAWMAALRAEPAIEFYKAKHAKGLRGPFKKLSRPEADEKEVTLSELFPKHIGLRVCSTIEQQDFRDLLSASKECYPRVHNYMKEPYYFCLHGVITSLLSVLVRQGMDEPVDIIYDRLGKIGTRAEQHFAAVQDLAPRILRSFTPGDDKELMPLQAADMAAAYLRRWSVQETTAQVSPVLKNLSFTQGIVYRWNRQRLEDWMGSWKLGSNTK